MRETRGEGSAGAPTRPALEQSSRALKGLRKRYVYGDFCNGRLRALTPRLGGAKRDRGIGLRVPSLTSFGEGPGGSLYATSLNGPVFRVVSKRGGNR